MFLYLSLFCLLPNHHLLPSRLVKLQVSSYGFCVVLLVLFWSFCSSFDLDTNKPHITMGHHGGIMGLWGGDGDGEPLIFPYHYYSFTHLFLPFRTVMIS